MSFLSSLNNRYKKTINGNKILINNFFALSVLQFLNLVLPLITLPYLLRVIGVENVGLLAFSQAFVFYFQIVTEYGFNLTATRDISVNTENKESVKKIYNETMTTKFFLFFVSGIVLFLLVISTPYFWKNHILYLFYYLSLFGQILFPIWFFQGVQQMKYVTYINVIAKTIFTILVFLIVTHEEDYIFVPLLLAIGNIISGIISVYYLYKNHGIFFKIQHFSKVKEQLISGKFIFLSQLKITLFSNTNTFVLGLIAGNFSVGLFNTAEKIIRAFASLQVPVVNTLFPYIAKEIRNNLDKTVVQIKKIGLYGTIFYMIILTPVFIYSKEIIVLLGTKDAIESSKILRILITLPLLIFLNNLFGTQILLNLNKDKTYFNILLVTAVTNIVLIFPLTYRFDYVGTSISVLITETLLFLLMWVYTTKTIKKERIDENNIK